MYKCGIYLRTSKNNADINNSIEMQKKLIIRYLESRQDIIVHEVYVDNGYSGLDFYRPGFIKLMEAVENKIINCIVVKDLSRFGRDYIQTGIYIQNILPSKNIRLIAVNDRYDSLDAMEVDNYFMVPLRNYINDLYSKDISIKVRSSLYMKMQNGECVICKVPYGYKKVGNKIVVDNEIKTTIQEIYELFIQGYSIQYIADYLNERNYLTPYEHRKKYNENYITSFANNLYDKAKHVWYPMMVKRILSDKIYIGILVQGKVQRPNYKTKKRKYKDEQQWYNKENNHESIIKEKDYYIVRRLQQYDIRRKKGEKICDELSGIIVCGNCGKGLYYKNNKYQCVKCNIRVKQEVKITKKIVQLFINMIDKRIISLERDTIRDKRGLVRKDVVCNIRNIVVKDERKLEIIIYYE